MHTQGNYTTYSGDLICDSKIITEPAILIDGSDYIVHKVGERNFVEKQHARMINAYQKAGMDDLAQDIVVFTFEKMDVEDIATIFNVATQCTGHPLIKAIAENDQTNVAKWLQIMQEMNY